LEVELGGELERARSLFSKQLAEERERAVAAASQIARSLEERLVATEKQLFLVNTLAARVEALEARATNSGPRLVPLDGVRRSSDRAWQWEAAGEGARFIVARRVERSWYRIWWKGRSEVPLQLKLYVDYGEGFSEEHSRVFGALDHESKRES